MALSTSICSRSSRYNAPSVTTRSHAASPPSFGGRLARRARGGGAGPQTARQPGGRRRGPRAGGHPLARRSHRVAGAQRAPRATPSTQGSWPAALVAADLGRHGPRTCGSVAGAGAEADLDALAVERDDLLHRLLALAGRCPTSARDEAAAVCTVAAHVAWVGGDGAIARAAVDRAVRLAPGYRLAGLLERPRRDRAAPAAGQAGAEPPESPGQAGRHHGSAPAPVRARPAEVWRATRAPGRGRRLPGHAERLSSPRRARVAWMPVMSPSAKPRFAGRQPSSRWGAPGDDLAAPHGAASASTRSTCHDGHPDEVDRGGLASR